MWRCASASRRERATVYELRIHHAALVFGRSIEPRARRAPGAGSRAIPGAPGRRTLPRTMRGAVKTKSPYDHAYVPDIRAAHPRQLGNWAARFSYTPHPPPDPSGSRPPRAPCVDGHRDRRPPHPAAIISRCSATASGDARHCRCRGATPDTPRSAYRARGPGSRGALGTSRHHIYPPAQEPASPKPRPALFATRERQSPTQVTLSLSTPLCPLKPLSHTPETLSLALNSSPLSLSYSLTTHPLTLTHSLKRIHSLTHTHPLTYHSLSLMEMRVDAHLTGSR